MSSETTDKPSDCAGFKCTDCGLPCDHREPAEPTHRGQHTDECDECEEYREAVIEYRCAHMVSLEVAVAKVDAGAGA